MMPACTALPPAPLPQHKPTRHHQPIAPAPPTHRVSALQGVPHGRADCLHLAALCALALAAGRPLLAALAARCRQGLGCRTLPSLLRLLLLWLLAAAVRGAGRQGGGVEAARCCRAALLQRRKQVGNVLVPRHLQGMWGAFPFLSVQKGHRGGAMCN